MKFSVEQIKREDIESFGPYRYHIYKDSQLVAIFMHNYRGECELIKFLGNGHEEDPPFGMCSDFISGGGSNGFVLTPKVQEYLEAKLAVMGGSSNG